MDERFGEGNTSVMSFSKVPCTPITGVHVNFYDIFGEVERIGTGSSCTSTTSITSGGSISDEQLKLDRNEENPESDCAPSNLYCHNCRVDTFGSLKADPYVLFLQEKQVELLGALHEEIRSLKHENAELKFQVHVILCQRQEAIESPEITTNQRNKQIEKEKRLELELESASKMIEELKWIQQHLEKRIRTQDSKIEHLIQHRHNYNNFLFEAKFSPQTDTLLLSSAHVKMGRKQLDDNIMVSQNKVIMTSGRRNSVQSILPENYKEQVATLPPIKTHELSSPTCVTPPSATMKKYKYSSQSASKSRKSSLVSLASPLSSQNAKSNNNFNFDN